MTHILIINETLDFISLFYKTFIMLCHVIIQAYRPCQRSLSHYLQQQQCCSAAAAGSVLTSVATCAG